MYYFLMKHNEQKVLVIMLLSEVNRNKEGDYQMQFFGLRQNKKIRDRPEKYEKVLWHQSCYVI